MAGIRPFTEADIDAVAELHRQLLSQHSPSPALQEAYRGYFREVYLNHPWIGAGYESLVYEAQDGAVVGFIGIIPRPLKYNGEPVMAAISSPFMVHPQHRSTLAGIQLMRAFLNGPQALSIADQANHATRRLWEGLGGRTSLSYSVQWYRALRPTAFLLSRLSDERQRTLPVRMLRPLARGVDRCLRVSDRFPFAVKPTPEMVREPLTAAALLDWFRDHLPERPLRPNFDLDSLEWTLARDRFTAGAVRRTALRDAGGTVRGCYLYNATPGGDAEVLFLAARKGFGEKVYECLAYDAHADGAVAITGHTDPEFMPPEPDGQFYLQGKNRWMLFASNRPELVEAFQPGRMLMTRLIGEHPLVWRPFAT